MDNNDSIIFGHRVLFHPRLKLDKFHNDFILWTDNVPFGDIKYVLTGSFNFAAKSSTIFSNQFKDRNIWYVLEASWIKAGDIASTLSKASTIYIRWHQFTWHQLKIEK